MSPRPNGLEALREHDFHRYLEAVLSLSGSAPTFCDLNDDAAVEAHDPVPSPDTILTALCQLAALRLHTKRAMLFFFDVTHAFVLAEATRNLAVRGEEVHNTGDPLWLGFSALPRGFSVCEQTISIVAPPLTAARPSKPVNVIGDLSEDTRFCGRPYVQNAPNARFYAGVPITSPDGINIGAFCVLDDLKRDALSELDQEFMRDMSTTIMTHLTLVRAKAEQKRETRMVTALGKFVQETSGLRESSQSHAKTDNTSPRRRSSARATEASNIPTEANTGGGDLAVPFRPRMKHEGKRPTDDLHRVLSSPDRIQTVQGHSATSHKRLASLPRDVSEDPASPASMPLHHGATATRTIVDDLRKETISTNIQSTFERAAGQVRDAIGVDGVVFLDASIGTYGGLREVRNSTVRREPDDAPHIPRPESPVLWSRRGTIAPSPCYVLGSSLAYDMPFDATETNFTEPLLESFLNKYGPTGKIWTFEGQGFEGEEEAPDSANGASPMTDKGPPTCVGAAYDRWERRAHADEIQRLFPRVRSFGFVGMWDHMKQRYFAGCIFWTSSPFRVLSVDSELRYISAFCDVIMTETKRLEAERSDRAKMDFLSSISHELRSPLHGILGSTECLQEHNMDVATDLLVSQIESCGRTLLDIIDHLLEYSRINFSNAPTSTVLEHKMHDSSFQGAVQGQHLGHENSADGTTALDTVTEDVVDAAIFSFYSGRDSSLKHDVSIMIDIDFPGSSKWKCRIAAGGWKRICMNIVTNALKYTTHGYIHVGLQTTLVPNADHQVAAVLTISDTGRGMSKEFLKNHLFRAFSQEDYLAAGIGLGMNLVAKIVHTLGGKIDVQSERNIGTRVIVYMPLQQSDLCRGAGISASVKSMLQSCKSVCIVDDIGIHGRCFSNGDAIGVKARSLLITTIAKTCGQLGLNTRRGDPLKAHSIQLNIIVERDLLEILKDSGASETTSSLGRKPLVVICETFQSERRLRKAQTSMVPGQVVEYLAEPCGPAKLEKAIASCLKRHLSIADVPGIHTFALEEPRPLNDYFGNGEAETRSPVITRPLSQPTSPLSEVPAAKTRLVLLLVDDNPINLQLLKTYATKRGISGLVACNGLEAVKVYKESHASGQALSGSGRPTVVLMDINMPVLDGYEATRRIRAYEQECDLEPSTVIALTGMGSADAQREAYTCGVDLFLTKPVQLKKLTVLLEGLKKGRKILGA